jgi:hypothetical protein
MIPAAPRIPDVSDMIKGNYYFLVHAPRRSGKTTCLAALTDRINSEGQFYAIRCELAALSEISDAETAMSRIVDRIDAALESSKVEEIRRLAFSFGSERYMALSVAKVQPMLNDMCRALDRELVVFFDDADCLRESPLVMLLAQIKGGYDGRFGSRWSRFPRSLAIVGKRDIRDYPSRVRPDGTTAGFVDLFNIKKKSLSLPDFTRDEIGALYGQHTAATGQVFEPEAVDRAWRWTEGQPWLVNVLADDIVAKRFGNDYSRTVTGADVDLAARDIITSEDPRFVDLRERIREPRVRRVTESVLVGAVCLPNAISDDDALYPVDLGLLKASPDFGNPLRPANPINEAIIVGTLTEKLQAGMPGDLAGKWMDGTRLDMNGILKAFRDYWRKNRESLAVDNESECRVDESIGAALERYNIVDGGMGKSVARTVRKNLTERSDEAFCLLVLFAFLQKVLDGGQKVLDGGAEIDRDYALGGARTHVFVRYKGITYPLELKSRGVPSRDESIERLSGFIDESGAPAGWLVVFDRNPKKPRDEKAFWKTVDRGGKTIHVVGC